MTAKINPVSFANAFTQNYVKSNPNASVDDVRVALSEELRNQKACGAISQKGIAAAQASVGSAYEAARAQVVLKPVAQAQVEALSSKAAENAYNAADAGNHYYDLMSRSKKARQNAHSRAMSDAKAVFGSDEFLAKLQAEQPEVYAEMTAPKPVNPQVKPQDEVYVSSKKRKKMKHQREQASQAEHKAQRPVKSKEIRNAEYCTSHGIMTKEAKDAYRAVLNAQTISGKSAKESAEVFMKDPRFAPIEQSIKKSKLGWAAVAVVAAAAIATAAELLSGKKPEINPEEQSSSQVA